MNKDDIIENIEDIILVLAHCECDSSGINYYYIKFLQDLALKILKDD